MEKLNVIKTVGRDVAKFNDDVSANSTIRISSTVKYLNDREYDNAYDAIRDAVTYLENGERSVWVLVTERGQGMAEIDLVKECPYWIARFRNKKLAENGTLSTTPKATAKPSQMKALLAVNAELMNQLAELRKQINSK